MRNICFFHKLLVIVLIFSAGSVLAQPPESTASTANPNSAQLAAQLDSLAKSQEQTATGLNELITRINSEMVANHDRIESFKEITNQLFWLFVFISAVSSALGVIVIVGASRREKQLRADYLSERRFYEERAQKYESQQSDLHSRVNRWTFSDEQISGWTQDFSHLRGLVADRRRV